MKRLLWPVLIGLMAAAAGGCSVISRQMMAEARTDVLFPQLLQHTDRYKGQAVVLGGHVIEVRNQARRTVMVILQSPLGFGQEPLSPDRSQGRFMLQHEGFLDPEVFAKGRRLTVAGRVLGQTRETIDQEPYDYPTLEALEIHLWERSEDIYRHRPYYGPPFYDPWYDPWYGRHRWRGYPYW